MLQSVAEAVGDRGVAPLAVQYSPQTVLNPAEDEARLRHVFLAGFKPGAPVDDLIAGYAALPKTVLEMRKDSSSNAPSFPCGYRALSQDPRCGRLSPPPPP